MEAANIFIDALNEVWWFLPLVILSAILKKKHL